MTGLPSLPDDGATMTGNVMVDVRDSENVKGTVRMNSSGGAAGGNNVMNMNSTFTNKWTAAACGDVP